MNITCNTQTLAAELRQLVKIVPSNPPMPILGSVLLEATDALRLSATDFELALRVTCQARIDSPGRLALPAKKLLEIIEQLPNQDVTIALESGRVLLTSGAFKSRLQSMPSEDFPDLPDPEGDISTLDVGALKRLVTQTRYAINAQTQKFNLDAGLLRLSATTMGMVTTDTKRLALSVVSHAGHDVSIVIPRKAMEALTDAPEGEIEFSASANHLFFVQQDRVLIARMIDAKFPAYERIIAATKGNDKAMTIGRAELAATLRRIGIAAEKNGAAYLLFEENSLHLAARSTEVGEADEKVAAEYTGDALRVCVNWRYVLDFLEAAEGQTIMISVKDEKSPMLLSDGESFVNVVMVMRA